MITSVLKFIWIDYNMYLHQRDSSVTSTASICKIYFGFILKLRSDNFPWQKLVSRKHMFFINFFYCRRQASHAKNVLLKSVFRTFSSAFQEDLRKFRCIFGQFYINLSLSKIKYTAITTLTIRNEQKFHVFYKHSEYYFRKSFEFLEAFMILGVMWLVPNTLAPFFVFKMMSWHKLRRHNLNHCFLDSHHFPFYYNKVNYAFFNLEAKRKQWAGLMSLTAYSFSREWVTRPIFPFDINLLKIF